MSWAGAVNVTFAGAIVTARSGKSVSGSGAGGASSGTSVMLSVPADANQALSGELRAVGRDVVTLRLDGDGAGIRREADAPGLQHRLLGPGIVEMLQDEV